ncbi:MAG: hypothetical protein AAB229_01225 [Candidatus Hydrogenedentota bacterium]
MSSPAGTEKILGAILLAVAVCNGSSLRAESKSADAAAGEIFIAAATITNAAAYPATVTIEGDNFIRRDIVVPGTRKTISVSRPCISITVLKGLQSSVTPTYRPQTSYYDYAKRLAERSRAKTGAIAYGTTAPPSSPEAAAIAARMSTSSSAPTSRPAPQSEEEASTQPKIVAPIAAAVGPTSRPSGQPTAGMSSATSGAAIAYSSDTGSEIVLGSGQYCGVSGGGVFTLAAGITVLLDISTVVNQGGCEEDAWRWKNETIVKSCAFDAPTVEAPTIEITPIVGYGEHADDATREALGNMASALGDVVNAWNVVQGAGGVAARDVTGGPAADVGGVVAGDVAGIDIPGSPGELPAAYATNALRLGQRLADACDRWAQGAAHANVNVRAVVPLEHITFDCREIEVCRNGAWVDGGLWNTEPVRSPLPSLAHEINDVTIGRGAAGRTEINRAIGRIRTWFRGLHLDDASAKRDALESGDPCSIDCGEGSSGPGGGTGLATTGAGGGARHCQPILNEIRQTEADLAEQRRLLAENQDGKQTSEAQLNALNTQCETNEDAARDALENARDAWRRAAQRERDILANPPASYASDEETARYQARVDAASAATRSADAEYETARQAQEDLLSQCAREREFLTDDIEFHEGMISATRRQISRMEALLPDLNTRYRDCLGQ